MLNNTSKLDTEGLLYNLHAAVLNELIERIQSGECTTGDLAVAATFLKQNNVAVDLAKKSLPVTIASIPRLTAEELRITHEQ